MVTVSVSTAKAQLSSLLDRVAAGETVIITRRGRPGACMTREESGKEQIPATEATKKPTPFEELARLRASMPRMLQSSAELIRAMRDESF